jgi:hypothetical protein
VVVVASAKYRAAFRAAYHGQISGQGLSMRLWALFMGFIIVCKIE